MTEQESRESIFYIIMSRKFTDSFGDEMGIDEEVAKQLADTLIAAGLTFDSEWKHRAKVAERALSKVFTKTFPWCCAKVRENIVNECLQEAEKELEGKDE